MEKLQNTISLIRLDESADGIRLEVMKRYHLDSVVGKETIARGDRIVGANINVRIDSKEEAESMLEIINDIVLCFSGGDK